MAFNMKYSPLSQVGGRSPLNVSKARGGSNAGKYPNVPEDEFCGPAGGAPEGTYPVNTPGRIMSAIGHSGNAPNPEGIKICAERHRK